MKAYLPMLFSGLTLAGQTFAADPIKVGETDWPWWRGPSNDGKARTGQDIPLTWSETKNVIWKSPVRGRGHGSPTVVGDKILLATADADEGSQAILAFDRKTGARRWDITVNMGNLPKKIHAKNTHASATVASDGQRAFAAFYNNDAVQVVALHLKGTPAWSKHVGPFKPTQYEFGYAPSPALYKDTVIVAADYEEGGFIVALDRETGEEKWKIDRPKDEVNYASPVIGRVAGREQLLISGCKLMASYDPNTGRSLWQARAGASATCGSVVWSDNLVFASGGYPEKLTVAVKADGSGETVWQNNQKSYEQSMLVTGGHLYALTDNGIAYCWHAADGTEKWKQRLRGPVSSSPILVNDRIYATNEKGTTFVFKATPAGYEELARNQLGDEGFATLTVCGDRVYIRAAHRGGEREEMLYCIGSK
ncbi:MAG: PQQ-binding-like beta-propeller repeat protein [Verrucomicrobiota bacterium]